MSPRMCECPKCGADISETYESDDPSVGIFGAGWYCEDCDEFVEDDKYDDFSDYEQGPEL